MKKLFTTTALVTALILSTAAIAHEASSEAGGRPMGSITAGLPDADAKKFHDAMHQGHEKMQALKEKSHALRDDLYSIVTADKFDKSAYLAKTREIAKLHEKMHAIWSDSFANALAQLPQDERTSIADAMKKWHEHRHHWHHDGHAQDGAKPADSSGQ